MINRLAFEEGVISREVIKKEFWYYELNEFIEKDCNRWQLLSDIHRHEKKTGRTSHVSYKVVNY